MLQAQRVRAHVYQRMARPRFSIASKTLPRSRHTAEYMLIAHPCLPPVVPFCTSGKHLWPRHACTQARTARYTKCCLAGVLESDSLTYNRAFMHLRIRRLAIPVTVTAAHLLGQSLRNVISADGRQAGIPLLALCHAHSCHVAEAQVTLKQLRFVHQGMGSAELLIHIVGLQALVRRFNAHWVATRQQSLWGPTRQKSF